MIKRSFWLSILFLSGFLLPQVRGQDSSGTVVPRTDAHGTEYVDVVRKAPDGTETTNEYQITDRGIDHLRKLRYYPEPMLDILRMKGRRVLDIGCGGGQFVKDLRAKGVEAFGLDIQLNAEQKKLPYFFEKDALKTGLPGESYDLIYSSVSVFAYERHNPPLLKQFFLEAARLLKPGGKLRISPTSTGNLQKILADYPNLKLTATRPAGVSSKMQEYVEIEKRK